MAVRASRSRRTRPAHRRRSSSSRDLALLVGRVEHVAARCRSSASAPAIRAIAASSPPRPRPTSWRSIALPMSEVAVGVEAADELVAVVLEVALDLEALPQLEAVAERRAVGELAAEAVGEHVVAAERDLGDHPGDRPGPRAGRRRARRRSSRRRATSGRARIARRPIAPQAICCAVACVHVAIGTIERTRSGYMIAHSSTCIPPIEPPITRVPARRCRGGRRGGPGRAPCRGS